MKSLMKGLLVAVCAVAGFASFGALKVTQEHYNWQNTAAHTNYYGNLVRGFAPTSVNPYKTNREGMLVDGISAFGYVNPNMSTILTFNYDKFFVYYGYNDSRATTLEWNFLDRYAKGVDISSMTIFGCWETDAGVRANVNVAKLEYATVDAPDTLVVLEGSAANCGGSIYNILTYADDTADTLLSGIARLKITFAATTHNYDGIDEIEIFGEALGDYGLRMPGTGNARYISGTKAEIVDFPSVEGMAEYCLVDTDELPGDQAVWQPLAAGVPTVQTFADLGETACKTHVGAYLRASASSPSGEWVHLRSVEFFHTATVPDVRAKPSISTGYPEGDEVTISVSDVDAGSTGGSDPGNGDDVRPFDLQIAKRMLAIKSGPDGAEDLDDADDSVTVDQAGDYVFVFTVVNEAGLASYAEVAVKVDELPNVERVWTGAVDTDWMNAANWSIEGGGSAAPAAGVALRVPAGCANYPELQGGVSYPELGDYSRVTVEQGAKIVFLGNTTKNCGPTLKALNVTVEGALDADGKGFADNSGTGYVGAEGASHGGLGKFENRFYQLVAGSTGLPYGNAKEPVMLGSGCSGQPGGGAIRLVVSRTLTVDGVVSANALTGARSSGGSVWISCGTFSGSGKVSANASAGGNSSRGGGGGRVAIHAGTKTFTGTVEVAPTLTGCSASTGTPGTLYEPGRYPVGTAEEPATITLDGDKFIYVFPDDDQVRYWNLDVKGSANVGFADGKLQLGEVTVAGASKLALGRWGGQVLEGDCEILSEPAITLGTSCHLMLPGAETQRELTVSALTVPSGAYLYFGCADLKNLCGSRLHVKGDLTVDGTISVVGSGSARGRGGQIFNIDGGSSHGGTVYRGSTAGYYGSLAKPVTIGSVDSNTSANIGGGAIELCVDGTMTLDGTVTAQGVGRGAGGSVWVKAQKLSGSGTINAGCDSSSERPGAGGRIAIEAETNSFAGTMKVDGSNTNTQQAYCGTISVVNGGWADDFGVDYSIGGSTKDLFTFSATADVQGEALVMTRTFSKCKPNNYVWTEKMSLRKHETTAVNTATYTVAGLKPNASVEVSHNGVAVLNDGRKLRTDAEGKIAFSAELTEPDGDTFSVRQTAGIALIVR